MREWDVLEGELDNLVAQIQRFRKDIRQRRVLRDKADRLCSRLSDTSRSVHELVETVVPEVAGSVFQTDAYTYRNRPAGQQ